MDVASIPPRRHLLRELMHAVHRIQRAHGEICETQGLSFQQFNALRILRGAEKAASESTGDFPAEDGLAIMEIAARMIEPEPGITRITRQLKSRGLINCTRCERDGRRQLCHLTAAGHAVLAKLDAPMAALIQSLLDPLDEEKAEQILEFLNELAVRAAAASSPHT